MSTIDQQFVEYIVKSVVGNPDAVAVERTVDERGVLLELSVDPEDLGRVIGKRGSGAQALRTLLRALGTKNDARYNLRIVDTGQPAGSSGRATNDNPSTDNASTQQDTEDNQDTEAEQEDNSRVAQTRKELEDLDDLDI